MFPKETYPSAGFLQKGKCVSSIIKERKEETEQEQIQNQTEWGRGESACRSLGWNIIECSIRHWNDRQ
jgi:hypothetical protein